MRMSIKELLTKLSGITTPIGGITWVPTKNERQIVYKLIQQLGNRRLINHYHETFDILGDDDLLIVMRNNVLHQRYQNFLFKRKMSKVENIRKALKLFQTFQEKQDTFFKRFIWWWWTNECCVNSTL